MTLEKTVNSKFNAGPGKRKVRCTVGYSVLWIFGDYLGNWFQFCLYLSRDRNRVTDLKAMEYKDDQADLLEHLQRQTLGGAPAPVRPGWCRQSVGGAPEKNWQTSSLRLRAK
jgi:hypothetical protein